MSTIDPNTHEPVVFKTEMPIRFTDIDRYGHVSTTHYLEFIFAHRHDFLRDRHGAGPEFFFQKGVGFYTRQFQMEFLRPIPASQPMVAIESIAPAEGIDGARFTVRFKILHPSGEPLHAQGEVEFRVIDLKKGTPVPVPDFLLEWLFTKKAV